MSVANAKAHDLLATILLRPDYLDPDGVPPRRLLVVPNPALLSRDALRERKMIVDVWPPLKTAMEADADLHAYVDEFMQRTWQRFQETSRQPLGGGDVVRAQAILDQASWAIWNAVEGYPDPWT